MSNNLNPCVNCGACCAHFRVSFYWSEADDGGGVVPVELTEPLNLLMRNMRGTNQTSPRCVALQGKLAAVFPAAFMKTVPARVVNSLNLAKTGNTTKPAIVLGHAMACHRYLHRWPPH